VVKAPGSLVGICAEPDFSECTVPVQEGDTFYFVTDGLMDPVMERPPDSLRDFDRTMQELRSVAASESRRDDASALCIKISGPPAWNCSL
jgi:serine phosphatase RsbU (regulator of sigma subunit)